MIKRVKIVVIHHPLGFDVIAEGVVIHHYLYPLDHAVVFVTVCSVICPVVFSACLEFPFVAGSCWQRLGAIMFSSVSVAALLL